MEKNIPTVKVIIEGLDRELELFEWMTQTESSEYMEMSCKFYDEIGNDLEGLSNGKYDRDARAIAFQGKVVEFLVKTFCKNLTYEEYDIIKPELRAKISSELYSRLNEAKKK